jgi:hypothetical protein
MWAKPGRRLSRGTGGQLNEPNCMTRAEELICAVIRGDVSSWPLPHGVGWEPFVEAAFHHNLHLVLFSALRKSSARSNWPAHFRQILESEVARAAALDLIGEEELRRVLRRLDEQGIRPILMKGVALAYTLYQSPTFRPRGDTDLLIRESDLQPTLDILRELGYEGPDIKTDKLISYECLYRRKNPFGPDYKLDVHWKINNAQLFANTFTFEELFSKSIEIRRLAPCARGLGYTHALLLACMHRFAHAHAPFYVDGTTVYAGDHLRWVYDIHLLCSALDSAQWSEFTMLARAKRIAEFCVDALKTVKEAFNTEIPAEAMVVLKTAATGETTSAQRLRASRLAWFCANLRALPNSRQRLAWIKQVALPPAAYMMERYHAKSLLLLPLLYGYRSIHGALKVLKRVESAENQGICEPRAGDGTGPGC